MARYSMHHVKAEDVRPGDELSLEGIEDLRADLDYVRTRVDWNGAVSARVVTTSRTELDAMTYIRLDNGEDVQVTPGTTTIVRRIFS